MSLQLTLPFPPSANTYWRHPTKGKLAGRHLISEVGRAYRQEVIQQISALGTIEPMQGRISIEIEAFMPDKRRRDLDNLLKALLDSLTHAGVWEDDSQLDRIVITRGDIIAGMVKINIAAMPSKQ